MNKGFKGMRRRIFMTESLWIVIGFLVFGILTFLLGDRQKSCWMVLGTSEILVALTVMVVGILLSRRRKKKLLEQMEEFSFCTESATRTAVLTFPSPLVVADIHGVIQWYNERFQDMIGREELYGEFVQDLFSDLQFSIFVEDTNPVPQSFSHQGKEYLVTGKTISVQMGDSESQLVGVYFTDLSEQKKMEKMIADRKTVVCSLLIDNYDEVFKGTQNTNHGSLIAEIEHCVNSWVEKGEGVSENIE